MTENRAESRAMSNIASILKSEISRIARKEIRAQTESIKKASSAHRAHVAALKREIGALEKAVKRLAKGKGASKRDTVDVAEEGDAPKRRFSAQRLAAHRSKLGLSAHDYGALIGVSGQSIYKWEAGDVRPRASQLQALGSVKGMGKREAQARLEALASKASKGVG